ncbi:DARS1, partial [Symbiodinium sp. KB8]
MEYLEGMEFNFNNLDQRFSVVGNVIQVGGGSGGKGKKETALSKKELRKLKKLEEAAEASVVPYKAGAAYGDLPLNQSQEITGTVWTRLSDLRTVGVGQRVRVRARVQTTRAKGKCAFMLLRQAVFTIQGVLFQSETVDKKMIKYAGSIPSESVVDVEGTLVAVDKPVESANIQDMELSVDKIYVVSRANIVLPFSVEDASRPDTYFTEGKE